MPTTKKGQSAVQKIPEYKMNILNRVFESDSLVKLLAYDASDALFRPSLENPSSLLYDRVFPYRFVPKPTEEQRTYLTIGLNGFTRAQEGFTVYDDYIAGQIYFYTFTHFDLMRTDTGVRQDLILGEIDRIFDGAKGLGMGELKLRYANELWMHNNKFGGYSVAFTVTDFK